VKRLAVAVTAAAVIALAVTVTVTGQRAPTRIVSLVPALTDMLLAVGARPQLVGVSSYDDEPEVQALPRVGALLDPDVERIISLRPDLVMVYGSQRDLVTQLSRASIATFDYQPRTLADVIATVRRLGARVGRSRQANAVATSMERRIAAVRTRVRSAGRPRTLLVFGRERGTLRGIYASGGRGFLHDMLEAAGGTNVYADVQTESVQVSSEMILARAPEVIIELRSVDIPDAIEVAREMAPWTALASVPAVRAGRLHLVAGKSINVPGPLVAEGVERIAGVLHPGLFR
jgi:iron complex transport system substrate-binding protein